MADSFFTEFKRRNVFKVGIAYLVLAWVVVQITSEAVPALHLPEWINTAVFFFGLLGFPFALFFAWAFEITPDGIKKESDIAPEDSISSHTGRKLDFIIIGLLVIGMGYFIYESRFSTVTDMPNATAESIDTMPDPDKAVLVPEQSTDKSIAVLPLINMSANPENAFFAGGVHEDILTNLSRIEGLKVISRTSVMRFINSKMSLRDIGVALGVNYIVEGSVRRIENHVRVTVQLIDARNDVHLWANNYDRELVDVFATQSALALEIGNSLHLEIQPETVGTLQGMPTQSVKAYDLFIKAKSIDRSEPPTEDSLTRQRSLLEEALREDPNFVEAWAFLNEIYDMSIESMGREGWFVPKGGDSDAIYNSFYAQSVRALKKAVTLGPDNVETLIARSAGAIGEEHLSSDWVANNTPIRKKMMDYTVEKYPESAMAWYVLGWWYFLNLGDVEAAKTVFEKALQLDPLHARIVEGSWQFFQNAADEEMVAMLYERLAQISPEAGKNQNLGKVSLHYKFEALVSEFFKTADQSLIPAMVKTVQEEPINSLRKLGISARLWIIQNDLDELVQLELNPLLQGDSASMLANPETSWDYLKLQSIILNFQIKAGLSDKAKKTAKHAINLLSNMVIQPQDEDIAITLMIDAHVVLGEKEQAESLTKKLFEHRSNIFNLYGLSGYRALSLFDPDRAVEMALKEQSANPSWWGLDVMATYHLGFRNFIAHPDMQKYYLKEGKWIDYLAERVPEYAQYRKH